MRGRGLLPVNSQDRQVLLQSLAAPHLQGMEVRDFTQKFWTRAERLDCQGLDINDIFHLSLDEHLPQWEMDRLKYLDYWNFFRNLQLHWEGKTIHQNLLAGTFPCPTPLSSQVQDPPLISMPKQRPRRRRAARPTLLVPSPLVLEYSFPVVPSPLVLDDPTPAVPILVVLEELTPVIPSSVVLEDPTPVVQEVTEHPALFVSPMILALPGPYMILTLPAPPMYPCPAGSESTREPALFWESSESIPEPASIREPSESTQEPAPSLGAFRFHSSPFAHSRVRS